MHLGRTDGAGAGPLGGDDGTDGAGAVLLGCDAGTDGAGTEPLGWNTETDGTGAGPLGRDHGTETGAPGAGCVLGGAIHFVQIVEITVLKTVDTVWLV